MSKPDSRIRYDLFIAHSSADIQFATKLYRLLKQRCRVFLASQSLLAGDRWATEIARALRESLVTVVLISSHTEIAFYQLEEIAAAIAFSRNDPQAHRVVPVYLTANAFTEAVPYGLRQLQSITRRGRGVKEVGEKLHSLLKELQVREEPGDIKATAEVAHPLVRETDDSAAIRDDMDTAGPRGQEPDDSAAVREAGLVAILAQLLEKGVRFSSVTVALIDIDNQTAINRRFGVMAGDQILACVYEMLRVLQGGEPSGRFGDDSFYVVFVDTDIKEVRARMEHFCSKVQSYDWKHVASELYVTCSIGVSERMLGEDARRWASRAGKGLKFAKAAGGNRVDVGPLFLSEDFGSRDYFDFS